MLTAVCDPPIEVLERCLESVLAQTTAEWEHIVVDDASTDPEVRAVLEQAAGDPRVHVTFRTHRGGIVAASSDALGSARGEIVALLDHDDELAPHALSSMAVAFEDDECDVAYSDHDLIRPDGRRADPFYKPDFSPERLRHQNYITHFLTARRSIVEAVGGFRVGFDGAQDHDLVLRLTEAARTITHIPDVLYHWRQTAGSVALDAPAKKYAYERGRRSVEEHCARVGIAATISLGAHLGTFDVRRSSSTSVAVLVAAPLDSGTVWGRERLHLARIAPSIAQVAARANTEVIVAVPLGGTTTAQRILDDHHCPGVVVEAQDSDRLWEAALALATSDVVIPLTEQMMLDDGGDINALAAHLDLEDVALVGCLQLNSDRTVRHGGFVIDRRGAHPILAGWAASHPGPGHLMAVAREVSAIDVIGGALRPDQLRHLLTSANDSTLTGAGIRLCVQRVTEDDRVIWTPRMAWYRFDPPVRRWPMLAGIDKYSNPHLQTSRGDWLEQPGCEGAAPYVVAADGIRIWS